MFELYDVYYLFVDYEKEKKWNCRYKLNQEGLMLEKNELKWNVSKFDIFLEY